MIPGLYGDAVDLTDLAEVLTLWSDRVAVLDKTGLNGLYKIQTAGWLDPRANQPPLPSPVTEPQTETQKLLADPNRPTLFAVIEELGLRLEPQTDRVETLFIDHIEVPSGN